VREKTIDPLSIVIPLKNEAGSIERLYPALTAVMVSLERPYEILFVNDGSTDGSPALLKTIRSKDPNVRIINLKKSYGQSSALQAGFDSANGGTIVSLDADMENDPNDIPRLLEKLDEGYDVVCGRRMRGKRSLKNLASAFGNAVFRLFLDSPVSDMACTLRAYKRSAIEKIAVRGTLHRYVPLLMKLKGASVAEVDVRHSPRKQGRSKYGILDRLFTTARDLFTIIFYQDAILNNGTRDYEIAG